jgi:hypothetical protein
MSPETATGSVINCTRPVGDYMQNNNDAHADRKIVMACSYKELHQWLRSEDALTELRPWITQLEQI